MRPLAYRPSRTAPTPLALLAAQTRATIDPVGAEVSVTGVTLDSRAVEPGDLFGAMPGEHAHGATYAQAAVNAGAAAIVTDSAGAALVRAAGIDLPLLVSIHPRRTLALASAEIFGHPSTQIPLIAVTGTNGKTTSAFLIEGALGAVHAKTALLGTVEMRIDDEVAPSSRTTVEAPQLQGLLARMLEKGVTAAVSEASSQALALERVTGTRFSVALFTNLQYEHLDFHVTMEEYFSQKRRLFTPEFSDRGVVLVDDEWGRRLAREATIPIETVATRDGAGPADWTVVDARLATDARMAFTLVDPAGVGHEVVSPLPGSINVSNAAGAVVAAVALGTPIHAAIAGLAHARAVPGRTEVAIARSETDPLAVVDYAHTPDGLGAVLEAMRGITPGRVIVVFGCDGLRDDSKRPGLGAAAARAADVLIVTDENPRTEPPQFIRDRILEGVADARPDMHDVFEVAPRAEAVALAMRLATPADTVIATGKGHETTQEIDGVHYPYTDAGAFVSARDALAAERDERPTS